MPTETHTLIPILLSLLVIAFLYSSVGHAGASGYIAVLTLFSLSPAAIKPIALVLNIFVSTVVSWQFYKAGHFSWKLFWPFATLSIPFALLGGYLNLPTHFFKIFIGLILIFSAFRFLFPPKSEPENKPPKKMVAMITGGGLGLIAGLTGTGGGIFLTPLLLFKKWANTKTTASISALFILVNSISGLIGNISKTKQLPAFTWAFVLTVILGAVAGSYYGSRKWNHTTIKRTLAIVLLIAGAKLILMGG